MKQETKALLFERVKNFLYDLIPVEILPFLSHLSEEDKQQIRCDENNNGTSRATHTLVNRLVRKDDMAFDEFVRALRETGCDHVAMLLDPQYTVPTNPDKTSNRSNNEQFSSIRNIAGTAADIEISAEILDDQGNNLDQLTRKIALHFNETKSQICRNTRRKFAERLPKGAAFVNTAGKDSAVFVFRICKVSAAEAIFEMCGDDSFSALLHELIVQQLVVENKDQAAVKTKITVDENNFKVLKQNLEAIESGQDINKGKSAAVSPKGYEHELKVNCPDFVIPEVHLRPVKSEPFKELKLRTYQEELARPALQGQNSIICAPTNSGKTFVALGIVRDHLKKNSDGKVLFVVSTVNLVQQQRQRFQVHLPPEFKISDISGTNSGEISLHSLIQNNSVIVLTAQILVNALMEKDGKKVELSDITMLILDECHHTTKDHPYNMIMAQYADAKMAANQRITLPQVVGLTASLGAGKASKTAEAKQHILQLCANMDAEKIVTVTENREELDKHVSSPKREIFAVQKPQHDPFEEIVNQAMEVIESYIVSTFEKHGEAPGAERSGQQYRQWCENLMNVAEKLQKRDAVTYAEQLRVYHVALAINEATRMKDALLYLSRYFERQDKDTFTMADHSLLEIYQRVIKALNEFVESNGEPENPKLSKLKSLILQYYKADENSKGILFSTTRESTAALESWILECEELKCILTPKRLVGTADDGMTQYEQEAVIKAFRDGRVNIIIATTVAEEGLDISDCNYVIRYDMKGNEISTVQSRGRIRAKNGSYSVVCSDKSGGVKRENINAYREMLMMEAIGQVQKMNDESLKNEVCALQVKSKRDREAKKKIKTAKALQHDPNDVTLFCKKCGKEACQAHDIRLVGQNFYVVAAEGFKEKIKLKDLEKPRNSSVFIQNKKVHCAICDQDWGTTVKIEGHPDIPSIKIRSFRLQMGQDIEGRQKINKWNERTFPIETAHFEDLVTSWEG